MMQMAASFKINFYFCNVKIYERYDSAAKMQRFLCPKLLVNSKRKECGSSNAHKVSARMVLTAPIALSLFNVKFIRL